MIITSKSGNSYLYNFKSGQFFYIPDSFKSYLDVGPECSRDELKISSSRGQKFHYSPRGAGKSGYYQRKYRLLKDSGFFAGTEKAAEGIELDGESIKYFLANTPQLTFEVTEDCNLCCEYCAYGKYYNKTGERGTKRLDLKVGLNVLRYMISLWDSNLNGSYGQEIGIGFYGGEPLLNFSFVREVVKYVKQYKLKRNSFAFRMTTNGTLLPKYMDFLAKHDFHLLISLDGNRENNGYRKFGNGKPSFKRIFENVLLLKSKYPGYFDKRVQFNAVLNTKNSIAEIRDFTWKYFNKIPSVSELDQSDLNPAQKSRFLDIYKNYDESLRQAQSEETGGTEAAGLTPEHNAYLSFARTFCGFVYGKYRHLTNIEPSIHPATTGTCMPFTKKIFVTARGKILPCERIDHRYSLGQAANDGIDLNFEAVAHRYNLYFAKIRSLCRGCQLYYNGCPTCMFRLNLKDNHLKCPAYLSLEKFKELLSSQVSQIEENPRLHCKVLNYI